jgi:YqaJ-like viral recombinase domain
VIEIFKDIEQGSPEWFKVRAGIPTMSCADKILAKGRTKNEESKTRTGYLCQLADEVIYGDVVEDYFNKDMERGKAWEAEARDIYQLETDTELEQVGFVKNHTLKAGCSPDSLIGKDGQLEVKTSYPRLWIKHVIHGTYPLEHKPQVQGGLWVTGRRFCDLVIYWPHRRPLITRIERDEDYIAQLALQVRLFNAELDNMVQALRTKWDLRGTLEASA